MTPRGYQHDCILAAEKALEEFLRILLVLPTGAGKTIIFSWLAKRLFDRGGRTLILAHREELIDQAIAKLHAATGIIAEKEKAESHASLRAPVVVASVQTMIRRLDKWPKDHFALIVADEAHHALSVQWQSVLNHFTGKVIGVTATPHRGDARNLGQFFESVAYEISLFDLIGQGFLSKIALRSIPLNIDLSRVKSLAGDFDAAQLGSALEPYLGEIAAAIRDEATFRRSLCFLPLIATSQKFVAACQAVGLRAAHIDGESPDRKEILERFRNSEFDVLSNAMLLTEGYDDAGIDCVCVLRPTRSQPLYAQMIGRGTRIFPQKENLLLLDFLWMHERHRIVRPANLIARDDFEADQISKLAENASAMPAELADQLPLDLQGLAGIATSQREEALRKKLEEQREKEAKYVSAEDFAMQHHSMAVAEYEPTMAWESQPISDKQAKYLEKAGINVETVKGRGHASKLLDIYFGNKPLELANEKTRKLMCRLGFRGTHSWGHATAGDARQFYAELKQRREKKKEGVLV